jgi:hypothetical protein
VGETPCVFLSGLHRAERVIAERLKHLASGTLPRPWIDPGKALPWIEQRTKLALAASQIAAIRTALVSKVLSSPVAPASARPPLSTRSCAFLQRMASRFSFALPLAGPQNA